MYNIFVVHLGLSALCGLVSCGSQFIWCVYVWGYERDGCVFGLFVDGLQGGVRQPSRAVILAESAEGSHPETHTFYTFCCLQ